jgi:hypothetical protein
MTSEMTEIARHDDGFVLYDRPQASSAEWVSLKLIRPGCGRKRKHSWWFGWNGDRLSRTSDLKLLAEHEPGVHQWVRETLMGVPVS